MIGAHPTIRKEIYDPYKAFHAHYTISSSIKPLHILTSILAEVFFGTPGQGGFAPVDDGVWDPAPTQDYSHAGTDTDTDTGSTKSGFGRRAKEMDIYGTGHEPWFFTTEADAGAFSIEVVTGPNAEEGGFVNLVSSVYSLGEIAEYTAASTQKQEST